jgi:hypothetical protein
MYNIFEVCMQRLNWTSKGSKLTAKYIRYFVASDRATANLIKDCFHDFENLKSKTNTVPTSVFLKHNLISSKKHLFYN